MSIVTATRNRLELLKRTVGSVLEQTCGDWELKIVDDASQDGTWSWLETTTDPRIHPIRLEEHSERSRARNVGLKASRGEFVLFLDDDDLLPKRALGEHLACLEKHPNAIASVAGYTLFSENGYRKPVSLARRPQARRVLNELFFGWGVVGGQALLRREIVAAVGGFDEDPTILALEDHDLWLRVASCGEVVLVADTLLDYRMHGNHWRPPDVEAVATRIRERALTRLEDPQARDGAARALRARRLVAEAGTRSRAGDRLSALAAHARVVGSVPRLYFSPLTRRPLWGGLLECLAGDRGLRLVRRVENGLLFGAARRPGKAGP